MELSSVAINERNLYNLNNHNFDFDFDSTKKQLDNIVYKLLDKGSDYVIKSLPIPDLIKKLITEIKDSVKNDGFKKIVSTAINSSVEEGIQLLNINKSSIKSLNKMFEVANKGGLFFNLEAGLQILEKVITKQRIPPRNLDMFFSTLNNYILSNDFFTNIKDKTLEFESDVKLYLNKCNKWYKAYSNNELDKANNISIELKKELSKVKNSNECKGKNQIIQNIMKLTNIRNDKITDLEFKLCHNFA